MKESNNFGLEFLKFIILETKNNVYEYDRFPGNTKNSLRNKIIFGLLEFVEKNYKKIKIMLFNQNDKLVLALRNGNFNKFQFLFNNLNDKESKEKYIKCLSFKLLGRNLVNLEMNDEYYGDANNVSKLIIKHDDTKAEFIDDFFDLSKIGYKGIKLWNNTYGIYVTFVKEQYTYKDLCVLENGDIVIDAGGCYGDTGLYFASKIGEKGKVYIYEFVPNNIKIMQENLKLNPQLAQRIEIIQNPVSDVSDKIIYFTDVGPSSKIEDKESKNSLSVETLSIDDTITRYNIERVDFIKMDIEGSELLALKGSSETIKKFKPKLAICVYHKLEDFYEIPEYIASLGVNYEYYFDYYTPVGWEMVLYCVPKKFVD